MCSGLNVKTRACATNGCPGSLYSLLFMLITFCNEIQQLHVQHLCVQRQDMLLILK